MKEKIPQAKVGIMTNLDRREIQKEKALSVVIPLVNEEENLRPLYTELKKALASLDQEYEMIFVDDGSSDDSFSVLEGLHNKDKTVKVIQFRRNFGKASALSAGFKCASGKVIVTMDADLQDDPKEIPNFVNKLDEGYDLVSGWRFKREDPFSKTISSRLFNYLTSILTGIRVHDFNCGFKAYRKEIIKEINLYGELHRYIPVLAHWMGYRIGEIKVKHHSRVYGKSKYGTRRLFGGLADLFTVLFLTRYTRKPLHLFGAVGLSLFLVGIIINIYLAIIKLLGEGIGDRPLLLLGVLLMVIGFQIISTGLIGEMIADTKGKDKEDYIIRKILD